MRKNKNDLKVKKEGKREGHELKLKNVRVPDQFLNLEGTEWNFQNVRVQNNILGHRQNLKKLINGHHRHTRHLTRKKWTRSTHNDSTKQKKEYTYTQQNLTTHVEETMPIGV